MPQIFSPTHTYLEVNTVEFNKIVWASRRPFLLSHEMKVPVKLRLENETAVSQRIPLKHIEAPEIMFFKQFKMVDMLQVISYICFWWCPGVSKKRWNEIINRPSVVLQTDNHSTPNVLKGKKNYLNVLEYGSHHKRGKKLKLSLSSSRKEL